jgi:D-glutamate cyclase
MNPDLLTSIRDLIQQDVGRRGLAADPGSNLLTECSGDFAAACQSIAGTPNASLAIVTGFFIPTAQPPAGETDGPLGATFLARALVPLGIRVTLVTDHFCVAALQAGLEASDLAGIVSLLELPAANQPWESFVAKTWRPLLEGSRPLTHLIAIERVGPGHTPQSVEQQRGGMDLAKFLREVPEDDHDRCHTARGIDITHLMSPAHLLFEPESLVPGLTTIGIGDGGNEIGMGKVPWDIIRRNIPNGARIACRIATHHLIVAGISNWGAYGLAAGVLALRGQSIPAELTDLERERGILQTMVDRGPLVDGMSGRPIAAVDGLSFDEYAKPLDRLARQVKKFDS